MYTRVTKARVIYYPGGNGNETANGASSLFSGLFEYANF